jgi:hypothetical protein
VNLIDVVADRLARRIARIEASVRRAAVFRMGVVTATAAGPPRTATVEVDQNTVAAVGILGHQVTPAVGEAVWIVQVGPSQWLMHGQLTEAPSGGGGGY